jgi:hypothetical protein
VVADLRRRLGVAAHLRPAGLAGGLAGGPLGRLSPRRRGTLVVAAVLLVLLLVVWFMVWLWDTPDRRSPVLVQPAQTVRLPPPPSDPPPVPVLPPVKSAVATTRVALPTTRKPVPTHKPSPRPSRSPTFVPASPPPPAGDVQAAYRTGASWDTGFIGGLDVQNTTGRPQMFTVVLRFERSGGVHISNAWNAELDQHRGMVILIGGPLAPGASLNVGFEATKEVEGPVGLTSCTVNDVACRVS